MASFLIRPSPKKKAEGENGEKTFVSGGGVVMLIEVLGLVSIHTFTRLAASLRNMISTSTMRKGKLIRLDKSVRPTLAGIAEIKGIAIRRLPPVIKLGANSTIT